MRTERGAPRAGAHCTGHGVRFCVWAPTKQRVDVCVDHQLDGRLRTYEMEHLDEGFFAREAPARAGDLYCYLVDGTGPFPDPVSRFQPFGVHGPSQVVDASRFVWSDAAWPGPDPARTVLYELHVGTFTADGTFAAATARLPYLRDLGINTIELMPVSDFPGERNWGYDVAAWFAPARCYGAPDDLRRLVDAAHQRGLAVVLDVVYNHLGPDGAYHSAFSPFYFSATHRTPWGPALNLDGKHSAAVRELLIDNAIYWLCEFHVDGLRLDATHALVDESRHHFLAELAQRVRAARPRPVLLMAEDERNEARLLRPHAEGGYGLDAAWADDFHHHVRRHVAGDDEGYFADFSGTLEDIATTVNRGWFFSGQRLPTSRRRRGTDPSGLAPEQFVLCLQNHDQIGNRAFGDRLHHRIDPAVYRALSVLLLTLPHTPLLFMGQEWAASTPFQFFTNHHGALGARVSEGRRQEFKAFRAFADAQVRATIPNPQRGETFRRSRLDWSERDAPAHAAVHALYRRCLQLRAAHPFRVAEGARHACAVVAPGTLALLRWSPARALLAVINIDGATEPVDTGPFCAQHLPADLTWSLCLHSEEPAFAAEGAAPVIDLARPFPALSFARPGAALLTA